MIEKHVRGTPLYLAFPMIDANSPLRFKSGLTVTKQAWYTDTAGTWASLSIADSVTEIGTSGTYELNLTATETDHAGVLIVVDAAGSAQSAMLFQMDRQGQYTSTINIRDSVTLLPVIGGFITVQKSGKIVNWGTSDDQGQVVLGLDTGTYDLIISATPYDQYIGTLSVTANATTTIDLDAIAQTVPSATGSLTINENTMTFADLVYRLCARRGLDGSPREIMQLRVAIGDAYRELPNRHTWKHYERQVMIRTAASQTFPATYDHTGGSYERLLTITSGTLPEDAAQGEFNIANETFKIERKLTPTTAIVSKLRNPGADFTGDIVWHKSAYEIPCQVRQIAEVIRESTGLGLLSVSSAEVSSYERLFRTPGTPRRFIVRASEDVFGSTVIELFPPPSEEVNYSISLTIRPDILNIFETSGTDGAGSSGGNIFTSASASFNSQMLGSVLRLSPSALKPRGRTQYDESLPEYTFQSIIRTVISPTQVELVDSFPSTFTNRGYTISDPVDINTAVMLPYLEAISWEKFCHNHDVKTLDLAKRVALDELRTAISAESAINWKVEGNQYMPWSRGTRLKDFAIYSN